MSREGLARRQAALVAALVEGAAVPPGFDDRLVRSAATSLARKRAGEVAGSWPMLRVDFGPHWMDEFRRWCDGRAPHGALRDGWDLARSYQHRLGPAARLELAAREVAWSYDGVSAPRRRRAPAMRRVGGVLLVRIGGRTLRIGPRLP
jgi:hypothetical protein